MLLKARPSSANSSSPAMWTRSCKRPSARDRVPRISASSGRTKLRPQTTAIATVSARPVTTVSTQEPLEASRQRGTPRPRAARRSIRQPERRHRPRHAQHLDAVRRGVALGAGRRRAGPRMDQRMPPQPVAAGHARAHRRIAVGQQAARVVHQHRVPAPADAHLIDDAPRAPRGSGGRRGTPPAGRRDSDRARCRWTAAAPCRSGSARPAAGLGSAARRPARASARAGGSTRAAARRRRTASARCRPERRGRCCAGRAPADQGVSSANCRSLATAVRRSRLWRR